MHIKVLLRYFFFKYYFYTSSILDNIKKCDSEKHQQLQVTLGELLVKLTSCKCKCDRNKNVLTSRNNQFIRTDSVISNSSDVNEPFNRTQLKPHAKDEPNKTLEEPNTEFSNLGCCDFRWELSEVSSTLIHLRPKSKFLPDEFKSLCLQISCRDTKFEPNEENKQQLWFQELKKIVFSNNLIIQNKKCKCDIIEKKEAKIVNTSTPPESPKPTLPPRKPRSQSDDIPKAEDYAKQLKDTSTSLYKQFGDPSATQDLIKSYIEVDKLQQEQKVFRYAISLQCWI